MVWPNNYLQINNIATITRTGPWSSMLGTSFCLNYPENILTFNLEEVWYISTSQNLELVIEFQSLLMMDRTAETAANTTTAFWTWFNLHKKSNIDWLIDSNYFRTCWNPWIPRYSGYLGTYMILWISNYRR